MEWAYRLLTVLLSLAIAQFGVLAAAPAHAHEVGANHAIHTVHIIEATVEWGAIAEDHHGHEHDQPSDVADGERDEDRSKQNGSEHLTHVHSCPQFMQASALAVPAVALASMRGAWPLTHAGPPSHASAPPDRPPRAIL